MKTQLVLIALVSLLGCGCAETKPTTQSSPSEISLSLGESSTLDGHSITFLKVLEDSRCPKDVQCIWAGRAILQFEVKEAGGASETKKIYVGATRQGEPTNLEVFSNANLSWKVEAVLPSKVQGVEISNYSVVLIKTPKD